MIDFGDELIFESYKIPWLIWIQLLVMILLVILLFFGFSIFTSDASPSSSSASTSSGGSTAARPHLNNPLRCSSELDKVEENQRVRREAETSTSRGRTNEIVEDREGSSSKESFLHHPNHPCNYFGLAKQAFLKCLGLDSKSDISDNRRQHRKED